MQCSMIKGLDVVQARHTHRHTAKKAWPGQVNTACAHLHLWSWLTKRKQPINNKQAHNHFCFGGHRRRARDGKAGLHHQWEKERADRLAAAALLSVYKLRTGGTAWSTSSTPPTPFKESGPISALVCINRSVIAYYNTIRAKEMREGKMLSANVEWQAQAPRPRIQDYSSCLQSDWKWVW